MTALHNHQTIHPPPHAHTSRVEFPDSCPDFKGRATSGFRPKLHSRAESLTLESLDMSRAVSRESLDIPKFGCESLEMGRESLDMGRVITHRPTSHMRFLALTPKFLYIGINGNFRKT